MFNSIHIASVESLVKNYLFQWRETLKYFLDIKLNFDSHIKSLCKKAGRKT